MYLSSHQHHRPSSRMVVPVWLPFVAALASLTPSVCGAWLVLQPCSFPTTVAAAVGSAVLCSATAVAVTRWHRRAVAAAVRDAVREAGRDPLTGLATRAALEDALDGADTSGAAFTVALVDVDGLHDINGRWGHAAGDQYLAAIAARLAAVVPAGGCLFRQGGDELTVVAAGGDAAGLQARIVAALAAPAVVAGRQVPLRASAGIAASPTYRTGVSARYVLACADTAMYTAKQRGGGRVLLYNAGRDGRPALDGTRPMLRRREIRPDPIGHDRP